ncbi:MAG: hypothetical protein GY797_05985 [Deltaproteobacteria bacterium]|nr:hypothetical protein [Deltaproteobacteria bacterium]
MLTSTDKHVSKHIKKYNSKILIGFVLLLGLIGLVFLSALLSRYFGQQIGTGQYILLFYVAIILFYAIFDLWCVHNWGRFTCFNGKIERGVVIGKRKLPLEDQLFLEALPSTIQGENIYKKENEIIVSEKRDFRQTFFASRASLFYRSYIFTRPWPHIGYINLLKSKGKLEFRTPISAILHLIIVLFIWLVISIGPFVWFGGFRNIPSGCMTFLAIVWGLSIIRILSGHRKERNNLMSLLKKARIDSIK